MNAETLDLAAGIASLVLTLMAFSYLLGDNFLYRIAVHILVGATAGYAAIIAAEGVAFWLDLTILSTESDTEPALRALGVIPFLITLSFVFKLSRRFSRVGNPGIAVVVGIGAGVAVMGAVINTLVPLVDQTGANFDSQSTFNAILIALGTIGTLIYFQYLAKRYPDGTISRTWPMRWLARFGQATLAVTFGATYAGAVITTLTILNGVIADQITFLLER
jgi:hypothetical protein